jgi:S-DNA-T family DNA segregation ATPase FtsK/SpoIIIE
VSIASRALDVKPAAKALPFAAVGLLRNGKWESAPFCIYAAAIPLTLLFRLFAGPGATAFVGGGLGLLAGVTALLLIVGTLSRAKLDFPDKVMFGCVAIGCGWLCAAVVAPISIGLYLVGLVVTFLLAIPYWVYLSKHRKPAGNTIVHVPEAVKPDPIVSEFDDVKGLQRCSWQGGVEPTNSGTRRVLKIAQGMDARAIVGTKQGAIAGLDSVNARYDDIELVEHEYANLINVYHHTRDLLANPVEWPYLSNPVWDIRAPIPIGKFRTGEWNTLTLFNSHLLIGGKSRSGKSNFVAALAIIASLDPTCDIWLMDGKRVELSFWRHAAKMYVQDSCKDANNLLRSLRNEITNRYDIMAANKWRKIDDSNGAMGPIVLFIDELPVYMRDTNADDKEKAAFTDALKDLLDRGAAAGLMVVATAQNPSAAQFKNGDLRAGFTQRIAFCMAPGSTQFILGQNSGVDASKLPFGEGVRGWAYHATSEDGKARQFRACYIPDASLHELSERASPETQQVATVLPPVEHYDAPEGHDVASTGTYPDGSPIPSDWRAQLWEMLDDTPKKTGDIVAALPVTRKLVSDNLRALEGAGFVTCTIEGKSHVWSRA